jgi:hypothetical protein
MNTSGLLLLMSLLTNLYITVITFDIIKSLKDGDCISKEKQKMLYSTTFFIPVLGYYMVRRIEMSRGF